MANKKGVIVYHDIIEQLEDFSNEQVGKMFRAIVNYDKYGIIPDFDGEMKIAFKFIKLTIDRNNEEYNAKCEMQRQKIQNYWDKQKNTNEYNSIQMYTNATDKDIDKDKDIDNNINKDKKESTKKFVPPTLQEIEEYAKSRKSNVDAKKFYEFFTTGNWVDSKGNKVKNWKQKFITWETHSEKSKDFGRTYEREELNGLIQNVDEIDI